MLEKCLSLGLDILWECSLISLSRESEMERFKETTIFTVQWDVAISRGLQKSN